MDQLNFKKNTLLSARRKSAKESLPSISLAKAGQSLVEILIAITVAFIMISGASALIGVSLHGTKVNRFNQEGNFLAEDLLSKLTAYSDKKWYCPTPCSGNFGIYNLGKDPLLNHYYLSTSTPVTSWISGDETLTLNGLNYIRYFYVENVSRDANGNIESSYDINNDDPSTQKLTIIVSWSGTPNAGQTIISKYIIRKSSVVFIQTDWTGGPNPTDWSYVPKFSNQFHDELNIQYSTNGEITIQ
ncbi:MAG: hypothetical protein EXS49_01395 [Candidatus Pacebacteria bacterium]|nr:hypothetical protein [Candidatus Paceibacterota bacterium]